MLEWYQATHKRRILLDYSKAFDLILHHILLQKLTAPSLAFLATWFGVYRYLITGQLTACRTSHVTVDAHLGGIPQLMEHLSGPYDFLMQFGHLTTAYPV